MEIPNPITPRCETHRICLSVAFGLKYRLYMSYVIMEDTATSSADACIFGMKSARVALRRKIIDFTAEVTARKRTISNKTAPDLPSSAVAAAGAASPTSEGAKAMYGEVELADRAIIARPAAVANAHGTGRNASPPKM